MTEQAIKIQGQNNLVSGLVANDDVITKDVFFSSFKSLCLEKFEKKDLEKSDKLVECLLIT